jgi:hypothetical protein
MYVWLENDHLTGRGEVENKSIPNYTEKISLLKNAKGHQIST